MGGGRSLASGGSTWEAKEPAWRQRELGHQAHGHKVGLAIWGTPVRGGNRAEASGSHLVELSPSMADSISSSYESSSDRPLGDAFLDQKPEPHHPLAQRQKCARDGLPALGA